MLMRVTLASGAALVYLMLVFALTVALCFFDELLEETEIAFGFLQMNVAILATVLCVVSWLTVDSLRDELLYTLGRVLPWTPKFCSNRRSKLPEWKNHKSLEFNAYFDNLKNHWDNHLEQVGERQPSFKNKPQISIKFEVKQEKMAIIE
ncbi:hypothetical protein WR25_21505 isoform B [Diploscapter pachys]|nr:hypothetical protein WR25_21505 isoform B [Diploscapter pachys]